MNKEYIALVEADCYSEKPTLRTITYIIPIASSQEKGTIINISNSEKIWTEYGKAQFDLSIEDMCKLILTHIPRDKVSEIVVNSMGIGLSFYDEICRLVREEKLDIPVKDIRKIRSI